MIIIWSFWIIHLQCLMSYFSLNESVIPATVQGLSRRRCAGVFPWILSHGVCGFISEPVLSLQYQVPIDFISRFLTWETGVVHYWFWNSDFKNTRDDPAICQISWRSRRLWAITKKMRRFFFHFWIGASVEDAKIRQFVTSIHLLMFGTNNNMWNRIGWKWKSYYFRKTVIRKHRSHVNISESFLEASDFSMRCVLWRLNKEMVLTHTIRIRERSEMEKENSGFYDPLASKAYLRKSSSNSLFYCVFFSIYGAYICLCNKLLSNVLYTGCIPDLI